ncbi:hypothetical protein ASPACDRAFT_45185 [Aspergillus aculeatus ATCC 16872]|uniref:Uncharacterized protein n=1 Tax=Aspergillus aculeatus (strain ATCC 16872 / CBS 172.66 / WB 5094) TaxID=690307 RepID=A0A1L9WNY2_ASPA1|nr:uncharacterized protein ASPACDRAFT_45185 [Aspergillus aculeatus ATCC 16872]OJJ97885.1 hypothetical protein ASPACDRAFT_45185 [Aspergillus aculeatus ATCC 16872]
MELGFPRGLGQNQNQNQNQSYGHRHPPVQQNSKPSEGQLPNFPYSVMDARSIPRTLGPAAPTPGPSILEQQHQQHSSSTSSSTTSSSIPPTGRPTSPPVAATGTAAIHSAAAAAAAAGSAEVGQQSADSLAHGNGNGNGNGENWASRVLQEMKDLMLLLSREGRVLYASPSCVEITGFEAQSLEKSDLFRYVHEDDKSVLTQELKECIQTGRLLRCHFRFCKPDSSFCLLEAHGHPHIAPSDPSSMPTGPGGGNGGRSTSASSTSASSNGNNGSRDSSSNNISSGAGSNGHRRLPRPLSPSPPQQLQQQEQSECRGIFLVCRPYPTRGAQLLNSFLEHKIENIRLNQRIAQLKEEEEEELNATQQSFNSSNSGAGSNNHRNNNRDGHFVHTSTTTTRQTYITTTQTVTQSTTNRAPARDTPSTSGEDNESSDTVTSNADDADSRSFPGMEGVMDRLPAVDDMSHIEGIEVMTGLYYGEGERSQGLSTGQKHGRLVHYSDLDGESSINDPQASRGVGDGDRRKRLKGEYMCTDCGTSDSPEWRKGPEGPKTLCNACGLRWAKKEKKRQDP